MDSIEAAQEMLLIDLHLEPRFGELINEITDFVGDERVPLLEVIEYAEIAADRIFADIEVTALEEEENGDIATLKMMIIDRIARSAMREVANNA